MASRGNVADFSTTETATESVAEESDQESLFSYPTPRSTTVSRTKRKRGRPPKTPSVIPQRARGKRGRPPLRKPHTTRCAPRSSASVDLQLTPTGRFTPETEPDSQLRDTTPFGNPPAAHPALRILLANPIESGGITYQTAGLDDAVPSDGLIRPVRPPHLTPFSTAPAAGPCPSAALPRTTRHAGAHSIDFSLQLVGLVLLHLFHEQLDFSVLIQLIFQLHLAGFFIVDHLKEFNLTTI